MKILGEIIMEFVEYRELFRAATWRNIKVRYKQTVMGFLWAILMPAIIVLSGIVVRKAMAMLSGKPLELAQMISVGVKALPWGFFVGSLKFCANSLVANMELVKKIYFPREVFPVSYVLAQFFDFLIAAASLLMIFIIAGVGISIHILWLPMIIFFLILLTVGLGMFISCGEVFFRDVKYITDVVLTFGIFFTPVFYDASMFGKWKTLLLVNPMGSILESMNDILVLHRMPNIPWLIYACIISMLVFLCGLLIFHKNEPLFAERI